jgi:FixJ family two-component response regulator
LAKKFVVSIVDDDESVREGLMGLMQSHGYDAKAFSSAADFLAADGCEDCLVVDIHMPGMTGLELCSHMAHENCDTPIIMITARHDEGLRKRALNSGAHCYLVKPLGEERLLECVRSAIKDRDAKGG